MITWHGTSQVSRGSQKETEMLCLSEVEIGKQLKGIMVILIDL